MKHQYVMTLAVGYAGYCWIDTRTALVRQVAVALLCLLSLWPSTRQQQQQYLVANNQQQRCVTCNGVTGVITGVTVRTEMSHFTTFPYSLHHRCGDPQVGGVQINWVVTPCFERM